MQALALQPDRLEGIVRVLVDNHADRGPVAEGPDPGDAVVDLQPARATAGPRMDQDDDLAARRLPKLLYLEGEMLERPAQLVEGLAQRVPTAKYARRVDDR